MIKSHTKMKVPDENKLHEMTFEVNWNPTDSKTNDCKMIRVTFPNGDESLVRKEHFYSILFAMGHEEQQRKMIPQTTETSRWYETVVSVKAKKNIMKGEEVTFPIKLTLPTFKEEIIGEMKRDALKHDIKLMDR